jgi:ferredoxin
VVDLQPQPGEPGDERLEPFSSDSVARILAPAPAPRALAAPPAADVRGAGLLRALERGVLAFDHALGRALPERLNPFLHTGAVAVTSFLVALVTGVALLLWYRPSVHFAYESVAAMAGAPWTAGLVRSLHRYSSDACIFFAMVHALRLLLARRFAGARWLAWTTGVVMLGIVWLTGWTGYWLVWDERAQRIALGTARLIDVVPVFSEPLARSFLTDATVNTFLFFVVFFIHMLIPLAMGLAVWLHLARLARPRWVTERPLTVFALATLVVLSAALPADLAGPSRLAALSQEFGMDWWYLAPLALTDRLSGGALWALAAAAGLAALSLPFALVRRRAPEAAVIDERCNACEQCYNDCPFNAISMVPRSDGNPKFATQAWVNPSACVGCGICAGSCSSAGVGLPEFAVHDQRRRVARWIADARAQGERPHVAFVCAESAGGGLRVDPDTGLCDELPGWRVAQVPCAGWVHSYGLEHVLRFGAGGALVAACAPGDCHFREGTRWTRERLSGERDPSLHAERVPRERVLLLELGATRTRQLVAAARAFREGRRVRGAAPGRLGTAVALALLGVALAGLLGGVSVLGYASPPFAGSQLLVSFKHPGQLSEQCRDLSEEEKAKRPVHMRQARVCDRQRSPVRLRVAVDGTVVLERSYAAGGLSGDLNSVALEPIPLPAGEHRVSLALGDGPDPAEWAHASEATERFVEGERRVVLFDRLAGFTWH